MLNLGGRTNMRLVRHMHSVGMLALVAGMPLTYTVRDCGGPGRRGTLYDTGFLPSTLQTAWDKYSGAVGNVLPPTRSDHLLVCSECGAARARATPQHAVDSAPGPPARVSICPPLSICLTEPHHSTPLTLPLSLISHLCPRVILPTSPPVPVPHLPSACVCDVLWRRLRLCDVLWRRLRLRPKPLAWCSASPPFSDSNISVRRRFLFFFQARSGGHLGCGATCTSARSVGLGDRAIAVLWIIGAQIHKGLSSLRVATSSATSTTVADCAFWGRWTQSIGSSRLVRPVLAPLLDRRVPPPPTRVTSHESHLATVKLASVGVGRGGVVALRVRGRARTCNHNLFVMPLQDRPASSGCLVASLGLPIDERWINPLSKDRPAAVAVCGRH